MLDCSFNLLNLLLQVLLILVHGHVRWTFTLFQVEFRQRRSSFKQLNLVSVLRFLDISFLLAYFKQLLRLCQTLNQVYSDKMTEIYDFIGHGVNLDPVLLKLFEFLALNL